MFKVIVGYSGIEVQIITCRFYCSFCDTGIKNFLPKYLHDTLVEVEVNELIGICREFRLKYSKPNLFRGKTAD